ncbi:MULTISPECIES: glycoside hydrolase family 16 protein [unclassified Methylobacterium]|uniref:glycoside hydrolase family 16 protein n=1 Tax=unclassified Methylobacterium TaxID=2615210 RepID=UPI0011C1F210|nr:MULTISPECIES: glycoside hydrolase family 16 protein [unclassified Methylobacterium]QEE42340.1 glycoside hydrolase family 16 protein [Methylobacterium sp. WL1]TXN59715.1 glycoside hydrolase family 16 protein [Methylobacterium sp. WL2]
MGARVTRNKWVFPTVAAMVGLATVAGCRELKAQGEPLQLCRYKKVFADDFNDLSVSKSNNERARWSAHTPWNGDFGDAQFIDPIDIFADPEKNAPFIVKDGILKIRARKHENGKWTSGLLSSADPTTAGFALMYGYFEARMKLPPGPGVWPAFWLNSNKSKDDKTPSVEIDVLEYYGQFPDGFHSVWHIWDKVDPKKNTGGEIITSVPSGSLNDSFHTYGVDVTKEWIVFYLDRREIGRTPTPPEHTKPLMILVNLALGSGWPIDKTPNPSDLLVDYVYAFAPDEAKRDAVCKE